MVKTKKADIIIVGTGVSGLYCALNLPREKQIIIVTKAKAEESDSFLAQGGICVLKDETDYDSFYEDTMRAGHYENNRQSVDIMIRSSREVIGDLVKYGARFTEENGSFVYTKEGAHSQKRILYHEDVTGKEITSHLLEAVRMCDNITLIEEFTMVDLLCQEESCCGIAGFDRNGDLWSMEADYTVLATGGIGGLYENSTNYKHLTGDGLAVALKHQVKLENISYIQIHPTTLYSKEKGRRFLISESVRGEGAILLNEKKERFVNELLPRDVVTEAIKNEMQKEQTAHVWLSLEHIPEHEIRSHFPNIYQKCLEAGYDAAKECIPVVPSQHYFMGGIKVNEWSATSMKRLYAVGETACNGVHGKNRLASNSLLESLVFAKRAASHIEEHYAKLNYTGEQNIRKEDYEKYQETYKAAVLLAIEEERKQHE